ncbi:hypothetical protein [Moorena sp. SIO3H5]|uniref:hypothetical protein n=1 Tax=Moorena sp. SIO3H5 TaxID=2607834 RepID=UPI0013BA2AB7|nr:hypothetical protein [Moorena sp. SIO3H5]NEO71439.1 hypothetical protein [Moorena sp. SIO3H5]
MEYNQFFIFVWRFNAILILVAGLLAIPAAFASLASVAMKIIVKITRKNRRTINVVNVNHNDSSKYHKKSQKLQIGDFIEVDGTTYIMLQLYYTQSYSAKSTSSIINYLFLDSETGTSKWLFSNNDYLIKGFRLISETNNNTNNTGESISQVRAVLYQLMKQDTNGDGRLTNEKGMTIAFTHFNGNDYQEVLTGVDRFLGYKVINANSLLIVYKRDGIVYSAKVSLDNFALSNEKEIAKYEKLTSVS